MLAGALLPGSCSTGCQCSNSVGAEGSRALRLVTLSFSSRVEGPIYLTTTHPQMRAALVHRPGGCAQWLLHWRTTERADQDSTFVAFVSRAQSAEHCKAPPAPVAPPEEGNRRIAVCNKVASFGDQARMRAWLPRPRTCPKLNILRLTRPFSEPGR